MSDSFGLKKPDQTWTGLVGMLKREEADISPALFTVTSEREDVVDFLVGVAMVPTIFAFKKQTESSSYVVQFFNKNSLAGIMVIFLLACLICIVAAKVHGFDGEYPTLSTFGSIVNQGVPGQFFNTLSMRLFFLTMLLFGICLTALFSARLSSLLTITKCTALASNFKDILDNDLDLLIPGKLKRENMQDVAMNRYFFFTCSWRG